MHPGHQHVGEQQIDSRLGLDQLQRRLAAGGVEYEIAELAQRIDRELEHLFLVVDDQDDLAVARARQPRLGAGLPTLGLGHLALVPRQIELHRGALAGLGFDRDVPAGLLDEAIDLAQPQPRSLAQRLGGEERLERAITHRCGHSRAAVAHRDADIVAGRHVGMRRGKGPIELHVRRADNELAAVAHRVARIDRQIDQRTLELPDIGIDRPQPARRIDLEVDGAADRPAQQLGEAADQLAGVERRRRERLAAPEREQLRGELRGALRARHCRIDMVGRARRVLSDPPAREVERANHDRQHIVEVVRNPAGQLADRFHLLQLVQLGLRRLAARCFLVQPGIGSSQFVTPRRGVARACQRIAREGHGKADRAGRA